jgi:hypothetical protein
MNCRIRASIGGRPGAAPGASLMTMSRPRGLMVLRAVVMFRSVGTRRHKKVTAQ